MKKTTTDQLVLAVQAQFYVKQLIKDGYSQREIAYQTGLSQANISRILLKPEYGKVKLSSQRKLAEVWENHKMKQINTLENKDSMKNYENEVFDKEDAEQGAKELFHWTIAILIITLVIVGGFVWLIWYLLSLIK